MITLQAGDFAFRDNNKILIFRKDRTEVLSGVETVKVMHSDSRAKTIKAKESALLPRPLKLNEVKERSEV